MEFTLKERDRRYEAVRSIMTEEQVDALVLYGVTGVGGMWNGNFTYLAERCLFYADALMFFPVEGEPAIFISGENQYLEACRTAWIDDIRLTRTPSADLCAFLKTHKFASGRIGVSSFKGLPKSIADELDDALPGATFLEAAHLVFPAREIKSDEELQVARLGGHLGDLGLKHSLEILRPGITELEWKAELERVMTAEGMDGGFNMLGAGKVDDGEDAFQGFVVPPTDRKFQKGDLVLLEISPRVKGYWGQVIRLVSIGDPPEHIIKAHGACLAAKHAALDNLRPGKTFTELAEALNNTLIQHGYEMKGIGSAHTIGLDLSESFINLENQRKIEPGFLATLHPMIATGSWRQLFVGETYFVHDDDVEPLNRVNEEIVVIN